MATYALTIGGSTKPIQSQSLNLEQPSSGVGTATFENVSLNGTYRPAIDDEVILTENGTPIFGGLITTPAEQGLGDKTLLGIVTTVETVDFNDYPSRRVVSGTIVAGSLSDAAQWVVTNWLAGYGVTLDAAQTTGPTLPEIVLHNASGVDVLNRICTLAAAFGSFWIWRINAAKVLRIVFLGEVAAPTNIVDGDHNVVGDIQVIPTRDDQYANYVIVDGAPIVQTDRVETFTGPLSVISLGAVAAGPSSFRGYLTVDGVAETIGAGGAAWIWDLTARPQTLTRGAGATGGAISITYDGTFTPHAVANGGAPAANLRDVAIEPTDIFDNVAAQALADAELAIRMADQTVVTYATYLLGLAPGQTQHITAATRNIDADFIITEVKTIDPARKDQGLLRSITASLVPHGDYRNVYKLWAQMGAGGGAGSISVSPGTGSGKAAPPNMAGQFNLAGGFGGCPEWIWDDSLKKMTWSS